MRSTLRGILLGGRLYVLLVRYCPLVSMSLERYRDIALLLVVE